MNEVDVVDEETSEEENLTTRELCMKVQQISCDLVFKMSIFLKGWKLFLIKKN